MMKGEREDMCMNDRENECVNEIVLVSERGRDRGHTYDGERERDRGTYLRPNE